MIPAKILSVLLLVQVCQERAAASPLERTMYDEERYLLVPLGDPLYDNPQVAEITIPCHDMIFRRSQCSAGPREGDLRLTRIPSLVISEGSSHLTTGLL